MTKAYSYSCCDCEGMESCPASVVAETKAEVRELIGHHARIAHQEEPDEWDKGTRDYLETLIREIDI
jgi:predicted small metal-binding protein